MDQEQDGINAAALLLARGRPLQPALLCGERTVSYGDLRKGVARAATLWQERGVAAGEVLMLRGDHGVEHVTAFLGAMWAGAVPVPVRGTAAEDGEADTAAPVRFVLDAARGGHDGESRRRTAKWSEWNDDVRDTPPMRPVPCAPWAPTCWTDPRSWGDGSARVLPHRFALALIAVPGLLPVARAGSMLGVLRALRRGVTAVLPARHAQAVAP